MWESRKTRDARVMTAQATHAIAMATNPEYAAAYTKLEKSRRRASRIRLALFACGISIITILSIMDDKRNPENAFAEHTSSYNKGIN